eukprot:CAMPEP_0171150758 /NCGR_PEP_ID=MMETSP0766_2-20121228/149728_2 /TAXON_ID=439317 /ORGANISM="Gambierdiscus australes, Strain CAWD 149" /LENGTH=117 /DNA_ID=CAMNT_0011614671 /DNA_START=1313 /DNA_END=1663 /DNA_ORIENTATION=-
MRSRRPWQALRRFLFGSGPRGPMVVVVVVLVVAVVTVAVTVVVDVAVVVVVVVSVVDSGAAPLTAPDFTMASTTLCFPDVSTSAVIDVKATKPMRGAHLRSNEMDPDTIGSAVMLLL